MLTELVREAGPLFGPVVVFGALALVVSIQYALRPTRRALAVGVGTIATTLLWGSLGLVGGIRRAMGVPRSVLEEQWVLVVAGIQEATSCLFAALMISIVASVLLTIGAFRAEGDARAPAKTAEARA